MRRALLNSAREKRAVPHPRDRSVRQLEKKEKRAVRLDAHKTRLKMEKTLQLMRFFWFREQCIALGYTATAVPEETVAQLVELYVDRNKEEMSALRLQRNPPMGRIKVLEATLQAEEDELHSAKGLRVPSMTDADDVEILTEIWDGAQETVTVVPLTSISMQHRTPPTKEALEQLLQRLRPVADIRKEAPVTLPKRAVKFHAVQSQQQSTAPSRMKVSIKKTEDTTASVRLRVKAREEAKQQKRLSAQRCAAMASRRGVSADEDA
ncbi:conserved hypothetical protein [Leishmania infantum JPCM5]|uniref:Protein_of_uncharacterized_function_(DUF2962)_-_p utative n=2 Tax=Leishmania infantum TaxID=5671 RepID=A0A6L0XTC4_LEIIN|nr:conserved hypothetical protein [Leishmania infantum JPCM5]CAC9553188.1 Protein_of_uncharacterised_function_(DUF2962)_-_putative [Leishmania infantum]CAM72468.1 conserved hypothetical protein [Leishmania infantum JPCM5]SUZ47053.1 Protein_of_uncharacterised_function_(DUF2962)_-_putative [Leishmania infantum]|eukprot:XP_001469361.1 conserved hypothetical protein [Leishmania infantum JPCM5]